MSIISIAAQKKEDSDCSIKDKVKCNSGTRWNLCFCKIRNKGINRDIKERYRYTIPPSRRPYRPL